MSGETPAKDFRAAIERELAERLAEKQASQRPGEAAPPASSSPPPAAAADRRAGTVTGVMLLCLKCRGTSAGDAHFCTSCGERFNALVIAGR